MRQWWPVAFLFGLLGVLFVFVFLLARSGDSTTTETSTPASATADAGSATTPAAETELTMEQFMEMIEQRQPRYEFMEMPCGVDGTLLEVPKQANRMATNRLGGVATDMMSIALGPPVEGQGRPSLDKQDWEMLLVTNPANGATYHGIDLHHLSSGVQYHITEWNLAALAPALAAIPNSEWTVEERILARVLTQRAAGVDDVELGFAALQGAYAANFGTWYGKDVAIPSSAFYALAAAYFKQALATDETLPPEGRSTTLMVQGEAYRLLGRQADALAAFRQVRDLGLLDEHTLPVLDQIEGLAEAGNYNLERAAVTGMTVPPGGYYLDEMLPAINGHIAYARDAWNTSDNSDSILAAIDALLAAQ
ncbi:hypothetical protein JW859_04625 [bacterium]|nr:hypothetical protein [bacterium]